MLNDMPTHFKGREETIRALNAYVNLIRASDSVAARMGQQIEQSGLTMGQFGVLEALLHLGPMCQYAIGEKLLRSGGNVTLVIDNLEKARLGEARAAEGRSAAGENLSDAERQTADRSRFPGTCGSRYAGDEPVNAGGTRDFATDLPKAGHERRGETLRGKTQEGAST